LVPRPPASTVCPAARRTASAPLGSSHRRAAESDRSCQERSAPQHPRHQPHQALGESFFQGRLETVCSGA
jgi:hypothetical protein